LARFKGRRADCQPTVRGGTNHAHQHRTRSAIGRNAHQTNEKQEGRFSIDIHGLHFETDFADFTQAAEHFAVHLSDARHRKFAYQYLQYLQEIARVSLLTKFDPNSKIPLYDLPALKAATILRAQLMDNNILAAVETPTIGQFWPVNIPNDAALIKIGPKPDNYWIDKRFEPFRKAREKNLTPQERAKDEEGRRWSAQLDEEKIN
jgi:hypothetical protein